MKKTAIAPANIAFIKYWGKKDEKLRTPTNSSISMNLSNLLTTTTVEFNQEFAKDTVNIGRILDEKEGKRVIDHLDRVRKIARIISKAKVCSKNNFPSGTGLSSSASGFAALTLAATRAAGLTMSEKQLSTLARLGSGSACRSVPDGFVEWDNFHGYTLYPPEYWDILDVVVVVSREKKEISSASGQRSASMSPFFKERLRLIKNKIIKIKQLIREKDFINFGQLVEDEALELHSIMLTSKPALIYFMPNTIKIIKLIQRWRQEGLAVYFTLNTGHNIHIIIENKNIQKLINRLKIVKELDQIIINKPYIGVRESTSHLF